MHTQTGRATNQLLNHIGSVRNSAFTKLRLADVGSRDPVEVPLITNSTIASRLSDVSLPQGRGEQQLKGCDLRGSVFRRVTLPGVAMEGLRYPESIVPYVIADWLSHEEKVSDTADQAQKSSDRDVVIAGKMIARTLKKEREASYWIKGRWPRGSRYADELDPAGELGRGTTDIITQLYREAGVPLST